MGSDAFVRSGIRMDRGLDGNSGPPAAWPHESNACEAGTGSVISGLEFLLASSGARIVTNRDHRVVWASSNAAALASGNSCIDLANGELAGRTRHSDAILREMFVEAERAAPGAVELLIRREPSSSPELFLRAQIYLAAGIPYAVFTIRNVAGELQEIPDLRRLYGLTRSEQTVIAMMMQGKSVTEVADGLHKSVLTIRSHLKRVYGKLNVRSREQLFSALMKLMVN
jgi:DNA-binding CsgD family transcriptional regulator